jgi:hypothetical protein
VKFPRSFPFLCFFVFLKTEDPWKNGEIDVKLIRLVMFV